MRRLLVQLDKIRRLWVRLVFDSPALMELEEYCGVYLAKFTLGRSKSTVNYQSRLVGGKNSWTITEQLSASVQLPVNFKSDSESEC